MVPSSPPSPEPVRSEPPNRVDATVLPPPPPLWPCLLRALAIGLLGWGLAAGAIWWFGRPQPDKVGVHHRHEARFRSLPADDSALRAWIGSQDKISEVEIKRPEKGSSDEEVVVSQPQTPEQGPELILEFSYRSPVRKRLSPPWQQLGYGKLTQSRSSSTGQVSFAPTMGPSYFMFLLARFLDLGFLIMGWSWLRRARGGVTPPVTSSPWRWRLLFAPLWGAAVAGLIFGYNWLVGARALTGHWQLIVFWPQWARIAAVSLIPIAFPLAQEIFFRGAVMRRVGSTGHWGLGLWVAAILFAALQLDPVAAPAFLILGLANGWLYRRTGRLSVPIVASAVCSFLVVVLPFLLAGLLDPAYLQEFMSEFLQKFKQQMNK